LSGVTGRTSSGKPPASRVAKLRILLIEDDPGDVRLIKEMLEEGSKRIVFEIEPIDKLATGLEKVRSERYDAVLLDIDLLDSKGLHTFYALHSAAPQLPIIVLSPFADEEVASEVVRGGAQDFLIKGRIEGGILTRGILYSIERKQAETALRGRAMEAESSQFRAETYFDFLAHDMANIISPIMAYAELISADGATSPEIKNKAAKIVEQVRRAASFILSLKGLEEAERTSLDRFATVDLVEVFPPIEARVRQEYLDKHLIIGYELPSGTSLRVIGGNHIRNILEGILENAANYADNDTVAINIKVVPAEEVGEKKSWQIEIADNGPGIPDDLKNCFQGSSNRPEGLRKDLSRGVASSLLVYSTVVKHFGGRIWVEDRLPGDFTKGAKIMMRLPRGE
jgi:signal transduction histidine kinase